jgi:uncharacterized protein
MSERSERSSRATARERLVELDVVRAVALIGVAVMNYHGYLILSGAQNRDTLVYRLFDPWNGPLSTRFAATFVTVAGMGVTLLTRRGVAADGEQGRRIRSDDRWTLIRRGLLLYAFGYVFDWIWPGTILFYYGALFIVAALLFTLRSAWLIVIGTSAALAATATRWWIHDRRAAGHPTDWLTFPDPRSPRGLLFDTFVNGTHPLLPWLAFFCLGMVLGRHLPFDATWRRTLIAAGVGIVVVAYTLRTIVDSTSWQQLMFSTRPASSGLLYVASTAGSTLVAIAVIGWIAQATRDGAVTRALATAGRMTLTLYVGHALVYNLLVEWWGVVQPGGLGTALAFALVFWVAALLFAVWWTNLLGMGPLERIYRRFGGAPPEPWPAMLGVRAGEATPRPSPPR